MYRLLLTAAALLFVSPLPCSGTLQLLKYMMTKPAPPACAEALATNPPSYASFSVTDPAAYLWFYVTRANAGDVFATEYYTPSGALYAPTSGAFEPLDTGGNWCFLDRPFEIAGAAPATMTGTWTVVTRYNGGVLFTIKFDIAPPGQACRYSISPSTATVAAAGGSGSATLSTQSGCTWSASSSVA